MKTLLQKCSRGLSGRVEVAAHVSLGRRIAVDRDVVAVALGDDSITRERVLRPRTAQKAPVPARPAEENPPPSQRNDRRGDEPGRLAIASGGEHSMGKYIRERRDGGSSHDRDRGRDSDRSFERDGGGDRGGARDVDEERPHGRHRGWSGSRERRPYDNRSQLLRGEWQSRDRPAPPTPSEALPVDRRMARSPRYLAVQQLMRVEEEGAYVGLVNGSPGAAAERQRQRPSSRAGAGSVDGEEVAGNEEDEAEEASALRPWREGGGSSGRGSRVATLDPRDQRLIKELVAGVTRLRRRLDYIVSNLSQQTPLEMQSGLRQVLRLGVFELTERRLAPHALNEHVQLAKVVSGPGAGAFVNGVLRSAARHLEMGTLPTPESRAPGEGASGSSAARDALRQLALQHSHPNWLVSRWLERFGREGAEALMRRNNTPPVYTVRINTLVQQRGRGPAGTGAMGIGAPNSASSSSAAAQPGAGSSSLSEGLMERLAVAGVEAEPSPLLPGEFLRIRSGLQKLLAEGLVSDGSLFVQDESAGLVVALLDPQPGERILDCCAAPGGKTLFAAARMLGRGSITALDVSAPRLGALRHAAELAGVGEMVTTAAADLRVWARQVQDRAAWRDEMTATVTPSPSASPRGDHAGGSARDRVRRPETLLYDKVLLDAPCTGTGVLAKRADLRWRRTPEQLQQLTALQDELLDAAATLVAPGGVLVYSTCSIEEEEDHQRVRAFLERHPQFELEPAQGLKEGAAEEAVAAAGMTGAQPGRPRVPPQVVSAEGFVATLPHVHNTDGAFAARMRRRQ